MGWISLLFRRNEFRSTLWALVLLAAVFYLIANLPEFLSFQEKRAAELAKVIGSLDIGKHGTEELTGLLKRELVINERTSLFKELLTHLAIAFFVAVIIIIAVESIAAFRREKETNDYMEKTKQQMDEYTKRTHDNILNYRDSVANAVWQAIFGRLVPSGITKELEGILKSSVVRENCRFTLTLMPPYRGMDDESIVLRREVTFNLKNLTNQTITHPLRIYIHSDFDDTSAIDHNGNKVIVPGHRVLTFDGNIPGSGIKNFLKPDEKGRLRNLEATINLEQGMGVEVYQCMEEQARLRDKNIYVQLTPTDRLTVVVRNEYKQRIEVSRVSLHHPNFSSFKASPDDVYHYSGGVLPGQSFALSWQPREGNEEMPEEKIGEESKAAPPERLTT